MYLRRFFEFEIDKPMWESTYTPVWRRRWKKPYYAPEELELELENNFLGGGFESDYDDDANDDVDDDASDAYDFGDDGKYYKDDDDDYNDNDKNNDNDNDDEVMAANADADADDHNEGDYKQRPELDIDKNNDNDNDDEQVMADAEDQNEGNYKKMPELVMFNTGYDKRLPKRMFNRYPWNEDLDIHLKKATLKASASVVGLEFRSEGVVILQSSGFIIEKTDDHSIILTSTTLLDPSSGTSFKESVAKVLLSDGESFDGKIVAYDFVYNIAVITTISFPRPAASLCYVNDHIMVESYVKSCITVDEKSSHRCPKCATFHPTSGDVLVALGRLPIPPYAIMTAPGLFGYYSNHKCRVLINTSCKITKGGIGGPLVNRYGEVIGVCLYGNDGAAAFLPVNIASMWWEHFKAKGETLQLVLGMGVTNLHEAPIGIIERIIKEFPDITGGVIVEKVLRGSSAREAGIKCNDIIVQLNIIAYDFFFFLTSPAPS